MYDTSSSISVESDEESKTVFEDKDYSLSSIKTVSEDSSLSLHNNNTTISTEQETDAQDEESNQRVSTGSRNSKPPLNPKSRRTSSLS
eukprot:CAMPEP_0174824610 /NCGR_PEP_ID=MMETSP1107-20130205/36072_1 /TAXON_ID=36770 /ORGANISM="Paraphysomonas vestita, Strain GFlagA" /LENGTH=87 /DNA_ID=CAMNT_0016052847 /DNA_START=1 /DNA_END=260 /DNA_ORIENTATION=-